MKVTSVILLSALTMGAVLAQTPAKLRFSSASVQPHVTPPTTAASVTEDDKKASYIWVTPKWLLEKAYGAEFDRIIGPEWLDTDNYDVTATLPPGAQVAQIPAMLQTLMADRFGLELHRETRDVLGYTLTVGKKPLKLKKSTVAEDSDAARVTSGTSDGLLEVKTLPILAESLEALFDHPVADKTGIKGTYDITLRLSVVDFPKLRGVLQASPTADPATAPSIFKQLDELGLKLESQTAPIEFIVIDKANRTPLAN